MIVLRDPGSVAGGGLTASLTDDLLQLSPISQNAPGLTRAGAAAGLQAQRGRRPIPPQLRSGTNAQRDGSRRPPARPRHARRFRHVTTAATVDLDRIGKTTRAE